MHLKLLSCETLFRELSYLSAFTDNVIDASYFEWGLHNMIGKLGEVLQQEIRTIEAGEDVHTSYPPYDNDFDAILLGYGLCSNGVAGLSSTKYPLVIPRAHDCVTFLLGSKERYQKLFNQNKGTFWFSPGMVECCSMPGEERKEWFYKRMVKEHGENVAQSMMEFCDTMYSAYSKVGYIIWDEFKTSAFSKEAIQKSKESAEYLGLEFFTINGSSQLLKDFIDGNWDSENFLIVPPGEEIKPSYNDQVITC